MTHVCFELYSWGVQTEAIVMLNQKDLIWKMETLVSTTARIWKVSSVENQFMNKFRLLYSYYMYCTLYSTVQKRQSMYNCTLYSI